MSILRRLRSAVALAAVGLAACAAPGADAADTSEAAITASKPHVLTLGDSITFAWNPLVEADPKKVDARKYPGFADLLGQRLGLPVDNAGCPGEASGSMLDGHAEDNGCRANRADYALHYPWSTPTGQPPATQVEFATAYLRKAIAAGAPPKLVTLTLGGNDLLLLQKHCDLPSIVGAACEVLRLPFYVHAYGEHLASLLTAIDATGYQGTMVLVTTYAPDYSDRVATLGLEQMNGEMKEHVARLSRQLHGLKVRVADGYGAFEARAAQHGGKTCETGLLIKNDDGKTCDIHPTAAGHQVLADAILEAAGAL
jgi:lysophospholipase L1-like esterase